jgi:glycerol-3-phosphate dehydrogenase (NAD(P)+)
MTVSVIGAGSWGTAVAALAASVGDVTLWALEPEVVAGVNDNRENPIFHPGVALPERLVATGDLEAAVAGAEVVVTAVPTQHLRSVLERLAPVMDSAVPVVSLAKGIEAGTLLRPTEVILEVLPHLDRGRVGVLSGPNLAREIMAGQAAATVLAFPDHDVATAIQARFHCRALRVYTNDDVIGCELAGALKNVIAVAAGMADGLGFGLNTMGALLSRGLVEMSRLGIAMGARAETFLGLAGQGDLVATCLSRDSRNHHVGEELAKGRTLAEITAETKMVAEGAKSVEGVVALAARYGVNAPIAEMVRAVVVDGTSPRRAWAATLAEPPEHELTGVIDLRDRAAAGSPSARR